jgi:altronate hydrolase
VKVATNHHLATHKAKWIDFDASPVLEGKDIDETFFDYVISVASGAETKNEQYGYREISIFKSGVTL